MLTARKIGLTFYADWIRRDSRVRGSLGTRNQDAARRLIHRLETAISEGPQSSLWPELGLQLPPETYLRFTSHVGVKPTEVRTWTDLRSAFETHLTQRVLMGRLSKNTESRYKQTVREFDLYLTTNKVATLSAITRPLIERYKVWRLECSNKRKQSRGGGGLPLETAILHRIFAFGIEHEMLEKNPVKLEGRPGESPARGAQPFTPEDLSRLRAHAGEDLLTFLLLRWTGLRGSDAVGLAWSEVHLNRQEIERVTQKRKKKVIVPIHQELLTVLQLAHHELQPLPFDRVLINPETGRAMSRPRLYNRMVALGKRAGVPNAHPHRFRDTLAVDMLHRGASPYDVAKVLGDTIETVEGHYTPFVKELRDRVRKLMANGSGIEDIARL